MTLTQRMKIRALQDEYELETGERPTAAVAAILLDREADAAYHREQATGSRALFGIPPYDDVPTEAELNAELDPEIDRRATYVGWNGQEIEDPEMAAMRERPRSSRTTVRNPILALPAARRILELDPASRAALAALLRDLGADAAERAETSWTKGKGPMAAYWKAAGVYARHIARALEKEVQR